MLSVIDKCEHDMKKRMLGGYELISEKQNIFCQAKRYVDNF